MRRSEDDAGLLSDRIRIRELVDAWAHRRDVADWPGLLDLWHPDGTMVSTWRQSSAAVFVAGCEAAVERGIEVQHVMGGGEIMLRGNRAVAETRVTITQRAPLDGILVDAECFGWMVDLVERRDGVWGLVHRQPVYERDRLVCVTPGTVPSIERELLESFPIGYRHLAYVQTKLGMTVAGHLPGWKGPERDALRARGAAWLLGESKL